MPNKRQSSYSDPSYLLTFHHDGSTRDMRIIERELYMFIGKPECRPNVTVRGEIAQVGNKMGDYLGW